MSEQQDQIDNLTQEVSDVKDRLDSGLATVQQELDKLESEVQGGVESEDLDFSGLKDAVSNLGKDVDSVKDLGPSQPKTGAAAEAAPTDESGLAKDHTTDPQEAAQQ